MPPGAPRGSGSGRGQSKKTSARPAVVTVDWRLPARLRRPVHQELARQRQRRRQREAIVRFERRPLYTSSDQSRVTSARAQARTGVEQHTADVYRAGRPSLVTGVPPYAGSYVRAKAPTPRAQSVPVKPKSVRRPSPVAALSGERDVPYQWATPPAAAPAPPVAELVRAPRRSFALPLHVSIWPFKRSAKELVATSKKKVQNSDFLTS